MYHVGYNTAESYASKPGAYIPSTSVEYTVITYTQLFIHCKVSFPYITENTNVDADDVFDRQSRKSFSYVCTQEKGGKKQHGSSSKLVNQRECKVSYEN